MIRKLRVKLVCILMALLTVMLGVTFGLVLHFTQQSLEAESLRTLEALANNWQTASSPGLDDGTRVPYFALEINARGDIITTRGGYFDLSDREKLQKLIDIAVNSEDDIGEVPDYGLRFYRVVTRTSWRVVFADTSAETTTLHSLIRTLAIASAAALAVFFVMSLLLARWLVRPVARAWDQQRQFVADASHELKTPLTVILTNAELLQAPGYDAPARSRFAGSILTMSQQMRGLVESLLELARVDAGRAQDAQTELDLSALVNDALLPFEPVLFEAGHTLTARVEDGIRVRGNAAQLRQVVEILLDNARKYASGGTVRLQLQRSGRHSCHLSLENEGPALSPQQLQEIFKRFTRADPARTRSGSFGLGLAIAQAIVQAHHGKIWAESRDGRNTFHVELPLRTGREKHQETSGKGM